MNQRDSDSGRFLSSVDVSRETLERMYVVERMSSNAIGRVLDISGSRVLQLLREHGIERRGPGWHRRGTRLDLTGKRFGKLLVEKVHPLAKDGDTWITTCDCGRQYKCRGHNLVHEIVTQCRECSCPTLIVDGIPRCVWSDLVRSARKRGIELGVTVHDLAEQFKLQAGRCALSGVPVGFAPTRREHVRLRLSTASLDRKDSNRGYEPGNIQWVHKTVNFMKQTLTDEDFIRWCNTISRHNAHKPHDNYAHAP